MDYGPRSLLAWPSAHMSACLPVRRQQPLFAVSIRTSVVPNCPLVYPWLVTARLQDCFERFCEIVRNLSSRGLLEQSSKT